MKMITLAAVAAFGLAGAASAQTTTSHSDMANKAATSSSTTTSMSKATSSTMAAGDKAAISKTCSDQANAKGLHGKERETFRSACKRDGGKA